MFVLIEISQGINFFALFKSLIRKTISNFLLFLEELISEKDFKIPFCIYSNTMQAHLQRKYFTKLFISNKVAIPKACLN
jgi:hypothetical protein